MTHCVYYTAAFHHGLNSYRRFLQTAPDIVVAEREVLANLPRGWVARHSEMVCTTTDDPFFKEL